MWVDTEEKNLRIDHLSTLSRFFSSALVDEIHMKNVLIICYSPLHRDPRVLRQIKSLYDECSVIAAGHSAPGIKNVEFVQLDKPKRTFWEKVQKVLFTLLGKIDSAYWSAANKSTFSKLEGYSDVDYVIANDIEALPIAIKLAGGKTSVIFDAHEYYPSWGSGSGLVQVLYQRYHFLLCSKYITKAHKNITVCDGIAKLYKTCFNAEFDVIMNLPEKQDLQPVGTNTENLKLVHHGACSPDRKLELMIELMNYLPDRYSLTFYLVASEQCREYLTRLERLARSTGKRITFKNPVPTADIPKEINQYDMGIYLLPAVNLNCKFALPNKFFEFVQSRLAIAIGPSHEMVKVLNEFELGIATDSFSPRELALKIQSLDVHDIAKYKHNADQASKLLNGDYTTKQWKEVIRSLHT